MDRLLRIGASLVGLILCVGCQSHRIERSPAALSQRLAHELRNLGERGFSGQVVVAKGTTMLLDSSYGFADRQRSIPVTAQTHFDIASVSKNFTAAAVLKLRDDHRLKLSMTLADLFPDVPPDKAPISVSQLLSHTSGLSDTYPATGVTERAEAVERILAQPLIDTPGSWFHYSDDNYTLLAAIIEIRSGTTYEQFLRDNLFAPAGMTDTTFWAELPFDDPAKLAALHSSLPASSLHRQWAELGPGGILSTAAQLVRWWGALRGGAVLPKATVDELVAPRYRRLNGTQVAFGWFRSFSLRAGESIWTRGNEDWGHNAILWVYPRDGYVIAVTCNSGLADDEPWSQRVQEEIEAILYS